MVASYLSMQATRSRIHHIIRALKCGAATIDTFIARQSLLLKQLRAPAHPDNHHHSLRLSTGGLVPIATTGAQMLLSHLPLSQSLPSSQVSPRPYSCKYRPAIGIGFSAIDNAIGAACFGTGATAAALA